MMDELRLWQFAWPWLLAALPLPLLLSRVLPPAADAREAALRVPYSSELDALLADRPRHARARWPLLPLAAWMLLCVAAARPQVLGEVVQPPESGREMLLAVDLSGSMATQDMRVGGSRVDRLTAVKAVLGDFLERRVGDRVGLLLFGERAYVVTPLTRDRNAVRQQLDDSVVGLAGRETAIGDAVALAVKRWSEQGDDAKQRVVVLLTDGVNTAGQLTPDKAAEVAKAQGVRVHTIGFGGENEGVTMFGMALPARQEIDEGALKRIAESTGGRYFRARDTRELAGIYAELDRLEPARFEGEVQRPRIERYPVPLAAALAFGLLALAWQMGRSRMRAP